MTASHYPSLAKDVRELLEDRVGKFLTELTDGTSDPLTSGELLSKAFKAYYQLRSKLATDRLDCAVLALTKSGKSTLLNAFCGATLLPSNNVPETARVVALEHCKLGAGEQPSLQYRMDGEDLEFRGGEEIRAQLEYLNREVRGRQHRKQDEAILTVKTELQALKDSQELTVGLRLLDTPGPNEAGEEALKHSVERLLDSVDAVVYVLDYTKLKTKEEADLLTKLSESNPQLIQRLAQRLFFVVNKVDVIGVTEGLDEDELRDYVADLVTRQMNIPSFQLRPDQIFLISAQDALLSRLILSNKATRRETERFAKIAFGNKWQKFGPEDYEEEAIEMLKKSHVLDLEESLLSYLYNNAGILKTVSLLDGIVKLLTQIKNVAATGEAAMKISAEVLKAEIEELQASLRTTSEQFSAVQKEANTVEDTVVENVRQRMMSLKGRLLTHIDEVLDPENTAEQHDQKPQNNWGFLRRTAAFILRSLSQQSSDSDAPLKAKLTELHRDVKKQIEAEITDFWHELEISTNTKHKELISMINTHLMELARRIESSVGKVLDLSLKPLDICLQKPSAEEFHHSIQDLLKNGINRKTWTETKHREEQHVEWQRRHKGLCNQTEYWEGVPIKKRVAYKEEKVAYDLDPQNIKVHFHNMVESSIDLSVGRVKQYVHAFMSEQIERAHSKIRDYSQLYTDTMTSVLEAKSMSAAEQVDSLASLEKHLASVNALLEDVSTLAKSVSKLFPQLDVDNFEWIEGELHSEDEAQEQPDPKSAPSTPTARDLGVDSSAGLPPLTGAQTSTVAPSVASEAHPETTITSSHAASHVSATPPPSGIPTPAIASQSDTAQRAPTFTVKQWSAIALAQTEQPVPVRGGSILGETPATSEAEADSQYSSEEDVEAESAYLSEDSDDVYDDSEDDSEEDDSVDESEEDDSEGSESEVEDSEYTDSEDFDDEEAEIYTVQHDAHSEAENDPLLLGGSPIGSDGHSSDDEINMADQPVLTEQERAMFPALAMSLSEQEDTTPESPLMVELLGGQIEENQDSASEVRLADETAIRVASEAEKSETLPQEPASADSNAASWNEHMTQFMSGLGVHSEAVQLPISVAEHDASVPNGIGHFVSTPSGPTGETPEATTPLLHSSDSSDEWECVSAAETESPHAT